MVIESPDERRVLALLLRFAIQRQLSFYEWRSTRGLQLGGFGSEPQASENLAEPEVLLAHIARTQGMGADCLFCKIINRELPADIVFEDDLAKKAVRHS